MAFVLLKLKQNAEEPYAIYDLEKFGVWPFRKKRLIVGSTFSEKNDIILIRNREAKKRNIGEIIKTREGWNYILSDKNKIVRGIFRDGLRIPVFDNIIEFKEEL